MSDRSDEPPPWSAEHRRWVKARVDDAAARAREALGAHDVLMVAWFQDIAKPQFLHVQDGGTAPYPLHEVYVEMQKTVIKRQDETDLERKLAKRYLGYKEESGSDDGDPGSSTVQ